MAAQIAVVYLVAVSDQLLRQTVRLNLFLSCRQFLSDVLIYTTFQLTLKAIAQTL